MKHGLNMQVCSQSGASPVSSVCTDTDSKCEHRGSDCAKLKLYSTGWGAEVVCYYYTHGLFTGEESVCSVLLWVVFR